MYAAHRLPGIRVEASPTPPVGDRFPRMDVAVFVGIAARGPCHRPVLVESVAAFEAAFGGTVPLAFDHTSGSTLTANLGPCVRAFFSNGGKRCWVIRVAWSEDLVAAWRAKDEAIDDSTIIASNRIALSGLLGRFPRVGSGESRVEPAEIEAASAGAWSDPLAVSARVLRAPISVVDARHHRWGLRFESRSALSIGDLIELREYDAGILRYAKVVHIENGHLWAAWSSSFLEITEETPAKTGHARLTNRRNRVDAQFFEGPTSRVVLDSEYTQLTVGSWVLFYQQGEAVWLRADVVDGNEARGPAWQQVGSRVPETPFVATRLSLDLRTELDGETRIDSGISLTPEARNSLFAFSTDDAHYAADEARAAVARPLVALASEISGEIETVRQRHAGGVATQDLARAFVEGTATLGQRPLLRAAYIPLGLGADFNAASLPYSSGEQRPLQRSGLVPFDHRLFVDPAFAGQSTREIDRLAVQRLDLENQRLFGMHAAYDIPGDSVGDASILAVPDAAQPGWALRDDTADLPSPEPGTFAPTNWHDHTGPCLVEGPEELDAPDFGGFLDSSVAVLARPRLGAPRYPSRGGSFRLSFSTTDADTVFVLEESARHDFTDAVEVWRGTDSELTLTDRAEGAYYYRLRTERDGNTSPYSARRVIVRASDYAALPVDRDEVLRVHVAMLRLAAGSAAMTALLSLPRAFRADDAQDYMAQLTTAGFGDAALTDREERSLSYGALFHPWVAGGREDALLTVPADGAVAGHIAALAQNRGAWFAPANRHLANAVGLYPAIAREDWLPTDQARINLIQQRPLGFVAHAARSLSGGADWGQVNIRRLMIMLRRMLLSLGRPFVFEPNGPATRRAIEREIVEHLDILQRRGAFSGRVSRESYFIRLRNSRADRDNGRILAEIGIAPAHPLEFIEIALVQKGERLTLEEAA
ncbi:phage tail sheath C-terminal domain-containing protein [Erythrobacter litoralis]|uniref:Tail sheath protein C-terminal domain-containing protein n=1 Tax=Erythrobacter litoralis (strain HTCC2594) TaxID=314225 RepID=Q2N8P0_ERYLH|nr:phage tail sheath C-terminal domain-containing protein [Erythrobacter litoralis]ABC63951.1 hypothetical protein ELI_09295 [Erythrobacter litoralis HTCC2594]